MKASSDDRRKSSARRQMAARSRGTIAGMAVAFVAVQLASGLYLDYARPLTRFPSAGQILDYAAKEPSNPFVVFLGSSRTGTVIHVSEANHVLAEAGRTPAPRVINAAVPAGDAISAEFVMDRLLQQGCKPEWVVIEVLPDALNVRSPFMKEHVVRQFNWEHVPTHFVDVVRSQGGWLFLESRLFATYTHRKQIIRETKAAVRGIDPPPITASDRPKAAQSMPTAPKADTPFDWGAVIQAQDNPPLEDVLKMSKIGAEQTVRRWLRNYEPAGPAAVALERLVAACREAGIGVILLNIPACTAHRQEYTPAIETKFRGFMDQLVTDYGCQYVDCRDWVPDASYVDALHVRPEDGKPFTHRLVREVLLPLAKRP